MATSNRGGSVGLGPGGAPSRSGPSGVGRGIVGGAPSRSSANGAAPPSCLPPPRVPRISLPHASTMGPGLENRNAKRNSVASPTCRYGPTTSFSRMTTCRLAATSTVPRQPPGPALPSATRTGGPTASPKGTRTMPRDA